MASNKNVVPEAKEALNRFKMEAAQEVGVNLKNGYNGDLTSKQAGSVGGQMVKEMCTERHFTYTRVDWAKRGQKTLVTYQYQLLVQKIKNGKMKFLQVIKLWSNVVGQLPL